MWFEGERQVLRWRQVWWCFLEDAYGYHGLLFKICFLSSPRNRNTVSNIKKKFTEKLLWCALPHGIRASNSSWTNFTCSHIYKFLKDSEWSGLWYYFLSNEVRFTIIWICKKNNINFQQQLLSIFLKSSNIDSDLTSPKEISGVYYY